MICCKYNSVSDSSAKFTRFGVSSYTCNLDFAVEYSMRGSRKFRQGGPGQSDKKSSDNVFFFFFFVLSLFYRSQMVNFTEIYHFSRFQRGSNIFQGGGGSNFFQRGSICLFPIETHITCDFAGGVRTPCPPSGSALV